MFGYERGAFTGAYASCSGQVAAANGDTAFFDEIGDISTALRAKLLRAGDGKLVYRLGSTKPVQLDVRVVAATNQDLEVPPLRERPDDNNDESPDALVRHDWPGNVHELKNVVEAASANVTTED